MKQINKNKKQYQSPLIEEVCVDNEISMMWNSGSEGLEPEIPSSASINSNSPLKATTPSSEDTPFGGNTISY